jgi:hypothetical protein
MRFTYLIIMFQVDPVPPGAPGPIRAKVSREHWEAASANDSATIIHKGAEYVIAPGSKRQFSIEEHQSAYIVCDVVKRKTEQK